MNSNDFKALIDDVFSNEFKTLDYSLYNYKDCHVALKDDDLAITIRITDSDIRYYLCIAVDLEFREDTPSHQLPIRIRNFVKKVISKFTPETYSVPIDGKSCELWKLSNNI